MMLWQFKVKHGGGATSQPSSILVGLNWGELWELLVLLMSNRGRGFRRDSASLLGLSSNSASTLSFSISLPVIYGIN